MLYVDYVGLCTDVLPTLEEKQYKSKTNKERVKSGTWDSEIVYVGIDIWCLNLDEQEEV